MATKTKSKKRFPELSPEVRQELLSKIDAQLLCTALEVDHLPKGIMGIYRWDGIDWQDDNIAMHFIVYEDNIDLDDTISMPQIDIIKVAKYFYARIYDQFVRIRQVNFSDLPHLLKTAGSY